MPPRKAPAAMNKAIEEEQVTAPPITEPEPVEEESAPDLVSEPTPIEPEPVPEPAPVVEEPAPVVEAPAPEPEAVPAVEGTALKRGGWHVDPEKGWVAD